MKVYEALSRISEAHSRIIMSESEVLYRNYGVYCICRVILLASVRFVIPSYLASIYRYHICHRFVCVCAHIVRYMDSLHVFNSLFIFL